MWTKEQQKSCAREHYLKNREEYLLRAKEYSKAHPEVNLEASRKYRQSNPEKRKETVRNSSQKHKESKAQYVKDHPEVRVKARKNYYESHRFIWIYRKLVKRVIDQAKADRTGPTSEYIGCTPEFLRGWLESKFTEEMNWENYGTFWEVDHVIPVSFFDIKNSEDQRKMASHYTNLRPLSKVDNRAKRNLLPDHFEVNP